MNVIQREVFEKFLLYKDFKPSNSDGSFVEWTNDKYEVGIVLNTKTGFIPLQTFTFHLKVLGIADAEYYQWQMTFMI